MDKKKIIKSCETCARLKHNICKKAGTKCHDWVNYKYTCRRCEFARSCLLLGKNNPGCSNFCASFSKGSAKNPPDMFPDAEEYRALREDARLLKEEKKKNREKAKGKSKYKVKKKVKDVGKKELLDSDDRPIKSPLVKVDKPKKLLDPTLQDKDRGKWTALDKIEEIVSRNYDPEVFALVDERDLPKSDNIIRFMLEPEFLNLPLYPRQLQICLEFFSAFCPYCSDTAWIKDKIEVDTSTENILDRTVLWSNGVCPKCKKTRYEALKDKSIIQYASMVLSVGQRCITDDNRILTSNGIERMKNLAAGKPLGTSRYNSYLSLESGSLAKTSKFFSFEPSTVYRLILGNNFSVDGTKDHPVLTTEGYKTLDNIRGDLLNNKEVWVPIYYGQNTYGNSVLKLNRINKSNYRKWEKKRSGFNGSVKVKHNIKTTVSIVDSDIATLLGFHVSEGHSCSIWNWDNEVLDFCYDQLDRLYPGGVSLSEVSHKVRIRYAPNLHHFDYLLGGQVNKTSAYRFVPDHILTSPKVIQTSFLMGLFEGDGYIEGRAVNYTSISKKLVYDVSAMLSNMGIIHRIGRSWTWATNGSKNQVSKRCYHISIRGSECEKYESIIGFFSSRKKKALSEVVNFYKNEITNRVPFWFEKFPKSVMDWMKSYSSEVREFVKNTYAEYTYQNPKNSVPTTYVRNVWSRGIFRLKMKHKLNLNLRGLKDTNTNFKNSELWSILPIELKNKWEVKYNELTNGCYFVKVKSCNKLAKKKSTFDFEVPYHHKFMANGILNHNSGKTSLLWMVSPAIIHEYLQIPNPAKFMRQLEVTEFHATFVGVTDAEAYKNVWSPMDNVFKWSPWYRMYHQFLDEEGKRLGTELYKHLDTFIAYNHKGIYATSGNADERKLRGKTRIISSIDEGAYLTGDKILMNAWTAYDALNNSLSTIQNAFTTIVPRFPWAPSAYGLYTSSTRSKQDFIMGMYKRSKRIPTIYAKKLATWEFNPNMPRDCEFIKTKYLEDMVAAERDYASNPPFANDPFIRKASTIVPILSKRSNVLSIDRIKITKDSLGGHALYPTIKCIPHSYPCCLTIDGGWKKNSFALALTHLIPHPEDPEDALIATSGILEIQPKEGTPISHNMVYEHVIRKIMETYNVKLFATDSWQGVDFQSRVFTDFGVDATQYSLKYPDFESLRTRINSETWVLPKLDGELKDILDMEKDFDELVFRKPVSHLMIQLLVSKDTGKDITKNTDAGEDFTDDILRAAALGVALVESEDYGPMFTGEGDFERNTHLGSVGAVVNFSAGSPTRGVTSIPGIGVSVSVSR